ncbi:unnamed protein product [Caenorhabditis brenneri]
MEQGTENKEEMPFESVEDLTVFLKSMVPTFKMDIRTRQWRNTRKFLQYLMQRLKLNDWLMTTLTRREFLISELVEVPYMFIQPRCARRARMNLP